MTKKTTLIILALLAIAGAHAQCPSEDYYALGPTATTSYSTFGWQASTGIAIQTYNERDYGETWNGAIIEAGVFSPLKNPSDIQGVYFSLRLRMRPRIHLGVYASGQRQAIPGENRTEARDEVYASLSYRQPLNNWLHLDLGASAGLLHEGTANVSANQEVGYRLNITLGAKILQGRQDL